MPIKLKLVSTLLLYMYVIDLNHTFISSNTTGSNAARNLPSILRFVQRRQHTAGVLTVGKKSWFVLFVCV